MGVCRGVKGLSPSPSQQLELEDALASTAYMEGPCGPPDDGTSKQPCLWRCFATCTHYWGAPTQMAQMCQWLFPVRVILAPADVWTRCHISMSCLVVMECV